MKQLVTILVVLFFVCTPVLHAEVFTSSSDQSFIKNVEKEITVAVPGGISAYQGDIELVNAVLVSVTEEYTNKEVEVSPAVPGRFIVWGLNAEEAIGELLKITILIDNNSSALLRIANPIGASPDGIAVPLDIFEKPFIGSFDLNGDGVLDINDVLFEIDVVFDGDADVTDLQKTINALIEEM